MLASSLFRTYTQRVQYESSTVCSVHTYLYSTEVSCPHSKLEAAEEDDTQRERESSVSKVTLEKNHVRVENRVRKKSGLAAAHREREQKEEQGIISEKCFNKFHCNKFLRLNK